MKNMAEEAGLATKFTNHSGKKTMMQTLVNQNFPLNYRHYSTVGPQEPAKRHSLFHSQRVTANGNVENPQFSRRWKPESFV